MDPRGQAAVRRVWTHLVADLEPKHSVLDYLHENGEDSGILLEEYQAILYERTREGRAQALLVQVMKTCPVQLFIRALRYEDAYMHLAEELQESLDSIPVDFPPQLPNSSGAAVDTGAVDRGTLREKRISRAFPRSVMQGFPWDVFREELLQTVRSAVESSCGESRDLKRSLEEDDQEGVTSLPRPPGRIPVKRLCRGPAHAFYRYMSRVLHGQWTFDTREGDKIAMKISFDPNVRDNPDVRFLAYFFDVHFKLVTPVSRGVDGMKEYLGLTSNPALSVVMYLTAKGRVAMEAGRLQEAKGILEAAEANAELVKHSLETLYFLRIFSVLKQKFLHLGNGGTSREEYNLVLARAGDVADQFSFNDENKGLLSVVHWHRARAYLLYDPDRDPPFVDTGESGHVSPELLLQVQAASPSAALEVKPPFQEVKPPLLQAVLVVVTTIATVVVVVVAMLAAWSRPNIPLLMLSLRPLPLPATP